MKAMEEWDHELATVAREVSSLASGHLRSNASRNKGLVSRKMATIQAQLKIERMFRRIRSLCEREFLLLPKEKALLHWSGVFLEKVEKYYELKQCNLTRNLWLKLIRTRIGGPEQAHFTSFDQDDIVSLSLRHAALIKSEKYLGDALVRKHEQKAEAVRRYQQLSIAHENKSSAVSMQGRLGIDLEHSLTNPVVNYLGRAMIEMTAPVHAPERSTLVAAFSEKYDHGCESLMQICEKAAVNRKSNPDWMPSPKNMNRVQATLKKLDKLEQASEEAIKGLMSPAVPVSRLKITRSGTGTDHAT
jgi:hypothetical protein